MLKIIICVFCASIIYPVCALALSDAEYQKMYKNSEYFREADNELTATWKEVYGKLTDENKKILLNEQRDWLKTQRDEQAKDLMDKGLTKECAYARVAHRRNGNLRVFEYNVNLSKEDREAGRVRADDYFYDEDGDAIPPECQTGKK